MPYHIDEENSELAFEVREGNKLVIKIKSNIFSDSLELYLIKVGDNTEPTDKNVFSSLRVLKEIENLHDTILKEINSVTSGFWELKQDSQGNEYIATKYNVLTEGGLTTYGLGEQKPGTIYDGLPIDNDTIYWEEVEGSRVLKAKGSGGGSTGLDETKLWNVLGTPGDQQIDYSHLRSAFSQFSNEFVTINTEQEITALKHFTAGLSVGESKKKIYEENGVVYIDADVAVTGAMTFYATAGRTVSTIMDAVTVDGITIKKENNVLKAVSGAGSSFDENAMWSALSGSSDNQINKSHLTMALDGYATRNWVIENYATKSELSAVSNKLNDFLEGSDTDTIINKWKELEAFLSGMVETDNLAEILETKADKKYVDSTFVTLATKQTITGEKTFSSVLNTAAIKASGAITAPSLAVSDWVTIAGIKLRKLEDGALMLEGNLALTGGLTTYASDGVSFPSIYDGLPIDNDTIYWQEVDGSRVLKAREGSGPSFDKSAMWTALAGSTTEQINKSHLTTALTGYATESWVTSKNYLTSVSIATISDLHANWDALLKAAPSAYVTRWPTISEVTDRKNLIIKLNGGSTEGTNLFTYNVTGEKTINITPAGIGAAASSHNHSWSNITSGKPSTLSGYGITDAYTKTESDNKYPTKTGSGASGTWGINVTGNAGTATKLQTARTLWGRSFDGTGNVSGNLDSVGNITGSGAIDVITKNSQNIRFKINNDDTLSVLLELNSFRPFGAASNSVNLGLSDAKWKDLYLGGNANIDGVTKTGDFYIGGIRLHKTADGVITLEGNLAVTGGITTYAIDPVSASTIMDGVVVDGTTIKKENGKLVAVGGGESGSVSWDNISGRPSVYATNIANITDLHSSWDAVLKAQKPAWLTAVSIATISDLHANWDALLKVAPSAYVTRWPTISEVTNKQNLIVKLNGGTTEGTNQFTYNATGAKTINITPAGIGAAASSHNHSWSNITSGKPTTLAGYGITDAPTKTGSGASGTWGISITGNAGSASKLQTTHTIWGKDFNGTQNISGEISDCTRIRNSKDNSLYLGNSDNTGWVYTQDIASHNGVENWAIGITGTAWFQKVNIGYAHPATGNYLLNVNGVISCSACTGNYIRIECDDNGSNLQLKSAEINNFRSPLYLQHSSSFNLICCKGGGKVGIGTDAPNGKLHVEGNIYTSAIVSAYGYAGNHIRMECDNHGENIASRIDEINNYLAPLYLQNDTSNNLICCNGGGKVGIGTTSPTHKLTVEGNAKFLNIETHYGIGTDETGISSSAYYDISNPTIPAYKYRYVLGWQDNTTEGYTTGYGIGVYRSASKWGSMILEVLNYENKTRKAQLEIRGHDNVLWFSGDILAEGGGTFYGSDIRYKTIVQHVQLLSLNKIAEAPSFLYRWNRPDMNQNRLNLGGSAQYTQSVLPWAVEDNSNFLMMDYATVAYTFAVHTARHLLTYETRTDKKIKKLENRVKYLEKQLKKLGYEEVRTLDDQSV